MGRSDQGPVAAGRGGMGTRRRPVRYKDETTGRHGMEAEMITDLLLILGAGAARCRTVAVEINFAALLADSGQIEN